MLNRQFGYLHRNENERGTRRVLNVYCWTRLKCTAKYTPLQKYFSSFISIVGGMYVHVTILKFYTTCCVKKKKKHCNDLVCNQDFCTKWFIKYTHILVFNLVFIKTFENFLRLHIWVVPSLVSVIYIVVMYV